MLIHNMVYVERVRTMKELVAVDRASLLFSFCLRNRRTHIGTMIIVALKKGHCVVFGG